MFGAGRASYVQVSASERDAEALKEESSSPSPVSTSVPRSIPHPPSTTNNNNNNNNTASSARHRTGAAFRNGVLWKANGEGGVCPLEVPPAPMAGFVNTNEFNTSLVPEDVFPRNGATTKSVGGAEKPGGVVLEQNGHERTDNSSQPAGSPRAFSNFSSSATTPSVASSYGKDGGEKSPPRSSRHSSPLSLTRQQLDSLNNNNNGPFVPTSVAPLPLPKSKLIPGSSGPLSFTIPSTTEQPPEEIAPFNLSSRSSDATQWTSVYVADSNASSPSAFDGRSSVPRTSFSRTGLGDERETPVLRRRRTSNGEADMRSPSTVTQIISSSGVVDRAANYEPRKRDSSLTKHGSDSELWNLPVVLTEDTDVIDKGLPEDRITPSAWFTSRGTCSTLSELSTGTARSGRENKKGSVPGGFVLSAFNKIAELSSQVSRSISTNHGRRLMNSSSNHVTVETHHSPSVFPGEGEGNDGHASHDGSLRGKRRSGAVGFVRTDSFRSSMDDAPSPVILNATTDDPLGRVERASRQSLSLGSRNLFSVSNPFPNNPLDGTYHHFFPDRPARRQTHLDTDGESHGNVSNFTNTENHTEQTDRSFADSSKGSKKDLHRLTPEEMLDDGKVRVNVLVPAFLNVYILVVVFTVISFVPIYVTSRQSLRDAIRSQSVVTAEGIAGCVFEAISILPEVVNLFSATWMLNATAQAFPWDETYMEQTMTQMCNLLNRSKYSQQILFLQLSSPTSGYGAYCSGQYQLTKDENILENSGKTLSDVKFNVTTELVGSFTSNNKSTLRYVVDRETLKYMDASTPYYPVNSMTEAEYTVDFGGETNPYHVVTQKWYEAYLLGKTFATRWSSNKMWTISGNTTMLSYTYPFIDYKGNLAQITGAIQPSGLERIIENLNLSAGVAMIMNPASGLVMGNTWGSALSIAIDSWNESYAGEVPKSYVRTADDNTNDLMRAAVQKLGGVEGIAAVCRSTTQWQTTMKYGKTEAVINVRRVIADDTGVDVVVVVVLLQSSFDGSMRRARMISYICIAAAQVTFVLLDLYLVYRMMRPFRVIIQGLRKAAVLTDTGVDLPNSLSRMKELAEMQAYFIYMYSQLMLMKTFLPLGLMGASTGSTDSVASNTNRNHRNDEEEDLQASHNAEDSNQDEEVRELEHPSERNTPFESKELVTARAKKKKSNSSSDDESDKNIQHRKEKQLKINEHALWEGINTFRRRYCTFMQVQLNLPPMIPNFGKLVAMFMEAVIPVVLRFSGVIEVQRAELFHITFGAYTETPMHQTKAARCAIELIALANEAIRPLISIVLDVGECHVGTCGASNRNARVAYCPRIKMQLEINLISHALLSPIVLTPKMASMLDAQMMTFPVDAITFSNTGQCVILYELRGYYDGFPADDRAKMRTLAKQIRMAFGRMLAGKYSEAIEHLNGVQMEDAQAQRLYTICTEMVKSVAPEAFSRSVREVIRGAGMPQNSAQRVAMSAKPSFQARHAEVNRHQPIGWNGKVHSTVNGANSGRLNASAGSPGFNGVVKLLAPGSIANMYDSKTPASNNASDRVAAVSALSTALSSQSRPANVKKKATFVGNTQFDVSDREKQTSFSHSSSSHPDAAPLGRTGSKLSRPDASEIPSSSIKSTFSALFEMMGEPDNSVVHRDCGSVTDANEGSVTHAVRHTLDGRTDASIAAYEDLNLVDPSGTDDKMSAWRTLKGELPMVFKDLQGTLWRRSENLLGTGSFSSVYRGMSMTGSLVALKCMALRSRDVDFHRIEEEVNIFALLQHENIVQYISCCTSTDFLTVIMELVPGGSLEEILTSFGRLTKMAARRFLRDILHGLGYLHSQNIVHCDIKPHNVLVGMDGTCKITDFGSSMFRQSNTLATIEDVLDMRGTSAYMAPEVARGEVPTTKSDIFSLGVTVLHMVMGVLPWEYTSVIAENNSNNTNGNNNNDDSNCVSQSLRIKTTDEEDSEKIAAGLPLSPMTSPSSGEHTMASVAISADVRASRNLGHGTKFPVGNCDTSASTQLHTSDPLVDTNPLTVAPDSQPKVPISVLVRNPSRFVSAIANGEVAPYVDPRFEDDVREFALACVNPDPALRPTAHQLLSYIWML